MKQTGFFYRNQKIFGTKRILKLCGIVKNRKMDKKERNNKIKVQLIDNLNGQTIGVSEMTADQLPETFSMPTTMHVQGDDWSVEEADYFGEKD